MHDMSTDMPDQDHFCVNATMPGVSAGSKRGQDSNYSLSSHLWGQHHPIKDERLLGCPFVHVGADYGPRKLRMRSFVLMFKTAHLCIVTHQRNIDSPLDW